jgi:hypothetical protein
MAQRLTIDGRIPLASNPFAGFGPRQNDLPLILEATFDQLHLAALETIVYSAPTSITKSRCCLVIAWFEKSAIQI